MNIETLIVLLRSRNGESKICVEVDGKRFQVKGMEIDGEEMNGFKLTLVQPVKQGFFIDVLTETETNKPFAMEFDSPAKKSDVPTPTSTTDVV